MFLSLFWKPETILREVTQGKKSRHRQQQGSAASVPDPTASPAVAQTTVWCIGPYFPRDISDAARGKGGGWAILCREHHLPQGCPEVTGVCKAIW